MKLKKSAAKTKLKSEMLKMIKGGHDEDEGGEASEDADDKEEAGAAASQLPAAAASKSAKAAAAKAQAACKASAAGKESAAAAAKASQAATGTPDAFCLGSSGGEDASSAGMLVGKMVRVISEAAVQSKFGAEGKVVSENGSTLMLSIGLSIQNVEVLSCNCQETEQFLKADSIPSLVSLSRPQKQNILRLGHCDAGESGHKFEPYTLKVKKLLGQHIRFAYQYLTGA